MNKMIHCIYGFLFIQVMRELFLKVVSVLVCVINDVEYTKAPG